MGRTQRRRRRRLKNSRSPEFTRGSLNSGENFPGDLFKMMRSLGWMNCTDLSIKKFLKSGFGLYSKKKFFLKGDVLIRIPSTCLITIATLESDENFKSQFNGYKNNILKRVFFQSLLSLYLLYQKHLGKKSFWWAYVNSLPMHLLMPYFCSKNELQLLPKEILNQIELQHRKIIDDMNIFKLIFSKELCSCCGTELSKIYNLRDFKWAFFIINSRSIYVPSRQTENETTFFGSLIKDSAHLALAPVLDFLNHSDSVESAVELQTKTVNEFDFILKVQEIPYPVINPYSEIFINYGTLSNLKLLLEYGFTLTENSKNYFEFSLQDILNCLYLNQKFHDFNLNRMKLTFIRDNNLCKEMFVNSINGNSYNLNVILNLIFKEKSHFTQDLNKVAFGGDHQLQNVKEETDLLISFKIEEYVQIIKDLEELSDMLTDNAVVVLKYLKDSVCYLKNILEIS